MPPPLALQNFVSGVELVSKPHRSVYAERKEQFKKAGFDALYVAATSDAITGDAFDHFVERLRAEYDTPRVKALQALIKGIVPVATAAEVSAPPAVDVGSGDGAIGATAMVPAATALTTMPPAAAPPAAALPERTVPSPLAPLGVASPEYLFGTEGIYDVSPGALEAVKAHFDYFCRNGRATGIDMLAAAAAFDAFYEDAKLRMPPTGLKYPLDTATRFMFNAIKTAGDARKHDAQVYASAKAHLAEDRKAIEASERLLRATQEAKRQRLMPPAATTDA